MLFIEIVSVTRTTMEVPSSKKIISTRKDAEVKDAEVVHAQPMSAEYFEEDENIDSTPFIKQKHDTPSFKNNRTSYVSLFFKK